MKEDAFPVVKQDAGRRCSFSAPWFIYALRSDIQRLVHVFPYYLSSTKETNNVINSRNRLRLWTSSSSSGPRFSENATKLFLFPSDENRLKYGAHESIIKLN